MLGEVKDSLLLWRFARISGLLLTCAAWLGLLSAAVFAQSGCTPIGGSAQSLSILDTLRNIFATIQAAIYIVIFLGWMSGLLMWSAPTRSIMVKRAGQQQSELSGIALFLVLVGPAIMAFITSIASSFGATQYCTPS